MLPNFKKIPGVNQEGEQTQRDIFFVKIEKKSYKETKENPKELN